MGASSARELRERSGMQDACIGRYSMGHGATAMSVSAVERFQLRSLGWQAVKLAAGGRACGTGWYSQRTWR
jgi:hypothetical protein